MDYADKYIRRMEGKGIDFRDATFNKAKIIRDKQIANSPTRSDVYVNNNKTISCCLATDVDSFKKRRFVFTSDTVVDIGSYIKKDEFTYLATKRDTNDVNPTVIAEVCNDEFPITSTITKIEKGKDRFGKPVYEEIVNHTYVPCLVKSSYDKSNEGDSFNIPSGRIEISLPYQLTDNTKYNFSFNLNGDNYSVKDLDLVNVINGIGYMKIIAEKVV